MFGPFAMHWRIPKGEPSAPPAPLLRTLIPSPGGNLELLSAQPAKPSNKTPVFFAHGGCGAASVWVEWMTYLSREHNIPCYAVSARGHGASYHPGFIQMVYLTTKRMIADDFVTGIKYVQEKEGKEVVLVGHSSGGGLSQFVLGEGDVKVKGLVLAGAIPAFGSVGVYMNWIKMDPWFTLRMLWHGWHPMSPLSSTALVKQAFFCDQKPISEVKSFEQNLVPYESFLWPIGMNLPFVNVTRMVQNILGWGVGERILCLVGSGDRLTSQNIMSNLASAHRSTFTQLVREKKIEAKIEEVNSAGGEDTAGEGVRFAVVPKAGHHLQNDLQWELGAKKFLAFYEKL